MLRRLSSHRQRGIVLVEMIVATLVATAVVGALLSAAWSIRKSIVATSHYAVSTANETRLMDYVAQDLRRAARVGMRTGNTTTVMKNYNNYVVNETNILTISVPDYYAANTPDNTAGSAFKTTRYPRATLNTSAGYNSSGIAALNGTVPWVDAVTTVASKNVTRFAPASAGSGEMEIRYFRGTATMGASSVGFFRAEYPAGATNPSQTRQIAERISDNLSTTSLVVSGRNDGLIFRLQSAFNPRYRRTGVSSTGTEAFVEVSLRNPRRD